ncbi:winged helix-turn-helix transcriptional regulator [Jiangella rhizosphaerae]|uniref:Transcriptional regulator n=1 Tax=Jiangella rhizosphaerae TaxID=2293569 RepID=A0A418KQS5_9ACTN|nr:helix-turn-helix domain-containing protein [Jiangella rhizosphaerae]RIQ23208.1 transcriptional regulator [Jiangella rhizosphaerae]
MAIDTRVAPGRPATGYEHIDDEKCRLFTGYIEIIGKKWSGGIMMAAARGATRFVEYRAAVRGISDRLLNQRLKELEAEGLIERTVVPTTPVLVQYRLTERGRSLMRALQPLVAWSVDEYERTHRRPDQARA